MLINISKYIGLVFEDRGRGPNGYDCWGLLSLIYKEEFGVNLPSYLDNYKDTKDSDSIGTLMRQERDNWKAIKTPWEILGDVVVIRMRGQPMHIGMVLGMRKFLHIEEKVNSVVEDYTSLKWEKRVVGFYRHWSNVTL